jgi:hypothetical protein
MGAACGRRVSTPWYAAVALKAFALSKQLGSHGHVPLGGDFFRLWRSCNARSVTRQSFSNECSKKGGFAYELFAAAKADGREKPCGPCVSCCPAFVERRFEIPLPDIVTAVIFQTNI